MPSEELLRITTLTSMLFSTIVAISCMFMTKPPSPVTQNTVLRGLASFTPIDAGNA